MDGRLCEFDGTHSQRDHPRTVSTLTAAPRDPKRRDPDRAQAAVDQTRAKMGPEYREAMALVKSEGLHTVCEEAG
jgi:lipoic acid synthetase